MASASCSHDLEGEELDFLASDEEKIEFEGFNVDEMRFRSLHVETANENLTVRKMPAYLSTMKVTKIVRANHLTRKN